MLPDLRQVCSFLRQEQALSPTASLESLKEKFSQLSNQVNAFAKYKVPFGIAANHPIGLDQGNTFPIHSFESTEMQHSISDDFTALSIPAEPESFSGSI